MPVHAVRVTIRALASSGLLAATFASATPSTHFTVTGAVAAPKTFDAAALGALAPVTQTDTFASGANVQTHTFTGASLWGVLGSVGIVTRPGVKNDVLNRYVLATGADGYRTVFSLGELSPNFGNRPDLVAYAETVGGVSTPLAADGFARVTAPGDVKGGRYVSNLVNLEVRASGSTVQAGGGGASTQFRVGGTLAAPSSFDLAALQALPRITETVGGHTYAGASFWDLLNASVGLRLDPAVKNDVLGHYAVATGSDGYRAVFSLGELDPVFGNQPDLIAYEEDGAPLGAAGFARLVVPNDVRAGRWVSNLVALEVFAAAPIPEPRTQALLLTGLFALGIAGRRRARRGRRRVAVAGIGRPLTR